MTSPFNPLLIIGFFTSLKVSPPEEKCNVSSRRIGVERFHFKIRMVFAIKMFTMWRLLNSRFVSPTASLLILSSAVALINLLCILLSSNFFLFLLNAVGVETSRQTNTGALALWDCVRTDGSDVMT